MLTKNTLKRTLKLSQVKLQEYYKDFNWDNLLSFNMEPAYNVSLPQDNLKEASTYSEYIQENLKDFKPSKDMKVDIEYREMVEQWFNKL